mgnify:FL=1
MIFRMVILNGAHDVKILISHYILKNKKKHVINFNELHIKMLMISQLSMVMQCDA